MSPYMNICLRVRRHSSIIWALKVGGPPVARIRASPGARWYFSSMTPNRVSSSSLHLKSKPLTPLGGSRRKLERKVKLTRTNPICSPFTQCRPLTGPPAPVALRHTMTDTRSSRLRRWPDSQLFRRCYPRANGLPTPFGDTNQAGAYLRVDSVASAVRAQGVS